MLICFKSYTALNDGVLKIRCPQCGHFGQFQGIGLEDRRLEGGEYKYIVGQRRCPDDGCSLHIFFVRDLQRGILKTYPSMRIDFEHSDIPDNIAKLLTEAITCHAEECYIAAAIMVRRTLEELCADRGAKGKDLHTRLVDLRGKVTMPEELFEALPHLKLLGNDAAHVISKNYDSIGKKEVEVAIDLTKEILKSCYQMSSLVQRLTDLQKGNSTQPPEPAPPAA